MSLGHGALVWFRRDLRTEDHGALSGALATAERVWCVFVFDTTILDPLLQRKRAGQAERAPWDRRLDFIHASLKEVDASLRKHGGGLIVLHGDPAECVPRLAEQLGTRQVFVDRDYEPAAIARDAAVDRRLQAAGGKLVACKDQVIFERDDIVNLQGRPYSVFTPYKRAWLARLTPGDLEPYAVDPRPGQLCPPPAGADREWPSLNQLGFVPSDLSTLNLPPGMSGATRLFDDFAQRIGRYGEQRDFPAIEGPSYLSTHLRFGTDRKSVV